MITVNTHEAKTNLSKLLNLVAEKHETVKICRNGKVMAELVAPRSGKASPESLRSFPNSPELSSESLPRPRCRRNSFPITRSEEMNRCSFWTHAPC